MKLEDDMTDKKSFVERFVDSFIGWAISGLFVGGCYAIARYILKSSDQTIELCALWLLWLSLAHTLNKPDEVA